MSFGQWTCLLVLWLCCCGTLTRADNSDCETIKLNDDKILAMGVISDNRLAIVTTSALAYVLELDSSLSLVSTKQPLVTIREEPSLRVREQWDKFQVTLKEDDNVKYFLYTSKSFHKSYLGAYFLGRQGPNKACLLLLDLEGKFNRKLQGVQCNELDKADTSTFVVSNFAQNTESVADIIFIGSSGQPNKTAQLYIDSKNTLNILTKSLNSSEPSTMAWIRRDGKKNNPTAAFYYEGHNTRMTVFFYSDGSVEIYEDSNLRYEIRISQFIQCRIPVTSTTTTTTTANPNGEPVTATEESSSIGWIVLFVVFIFIFGLLALFYYKMYRNKERKKKDKERRRKIKQLEKELEPSFFEKSSSMSASSRKAEFYADSHKSGKIAPMSTKENCSIVPKPVQSNVDTSALASSTSPVSAKGPKPSKSKLSKLSSVKSKSPTTVTSKPDVSKAAASTTSSVTSKPSASSPSKSKQSSKYLTTSKLESLKNQLFDRLISAFKRPTKSKKNKNVSKKNKKKDKKKDDKPDGK